MRSYELDALGHLNQAVYHSYAEVARVEAFIAAGVSWDDLVATGVGPVMLASQINFRRELRGGEKVDVTCELKFGDGKTFVVDQRILKVDGTLSAEISSVIGLMDLSARKLLEDPRAVLEKAGLDLSGLSA